LSFLEAARRIPTADRVGLLIDDDAQASLDVPVAHHQTRPMTPVLSPDPRRTALTSLALVVVPRACRCQDAVSSIALACR
jgi:hypothetical protein